MRTPFLLAAGRHVECRTLVMTPVILNLDSAFDWTAEVRVILDQLDWESIRTVVAPTISGHDWTARRDRLGMIALVSDVFIQECYQIPWRDQEHADCEDDAHGWRKEWRERQLRGSKDQLESEAKNSNCPTHPKYRLNSEAPFFRPPRVGRRGIVECYGMYVDEAETLPHSRPLLRAIPDGCRHAPAIFLCPERLCEVYPILLKLRENFRHPPPLSSNPTLFSLRMTLLHELGHHFFPVHRSGAGHCLGEGLANLFCHAALDDAQRAWLLYKSWHLQPPEYSAYRPLKVVCGADSDCRVAVSSCFHCTLKGWALLPKKDSDRFERDIGASLNMALAADAPACYGLAKELRECVSSENNWFFPCDGIHWHHLRRSADGCLPADMVLDLYKKANLAAWITRADMPKRFWGRWAYGESVRWPHDCVHLDVQDTDKWFGYYAETRETPIASVVCEKLVDLLKGNPSLRVAASQRAALDRAIEVASDRRELWFDRVPAIELIEACSDTRSIPTLNAIIDAERSGDVYEAAREALQKLEVTHGKR